jgi:hypothetical protein
VGEEEEDYTLGKSFTERNVSLCGRTSGSSEVAAAMKREEEKKERKGEEEERARSNRYVLKGASHGDALLCPKGASEGGVTLHVMKTLIKVNSK